IPAGFSGQRGGHEIEPGAAERMAAQQPRQRHPAAGPQAKPADRLVGVFRAGRQVPAMPADQRREGVAIDLDQAASCQPGGTGHGGEEGRAHAYSAANEPRRLASIWSIAETTASKVSKVEAWRAL